MLWILTCAAIATGFPATELVRSDANQLLSVSNAGVGRERVRSHLIILDVDLEPGSAQALSFVAGDNRRMGPLVWGLAGDALYRAPYADRGGRTVTVGNDVLGDYVPWRRDRRERRHDPQRYERMTQHSAQYGRAGTLLESFMTRLDATDPEWKTKQLSFDLVYTGPNTIMQLAVFEGRLYWWSSESADEWTDRGDFETEMTGPFRIVQAGEDLYLIDHDGRVFSGPGRGHRQIGSIINWEEPGRGETHFLFEDQLEDRIAVVNVAGEDMTVLEFRGDPEAAQDFYTSIESPELRATIRKMSNVIRQHEDE